MAPKIKKNREDEGFNRFKKIVDIKLDPVSMVLKAHLLAEYYIDQFIALKMPKGNILLDRGFTFSQKLSVLKAIDILLDDDSDQLEALNKIRNKCAHDMEYSISEADIDRIGFPQGRYYFKLKEEFPINKRKKHLLYVTLIGVVASLDGLCRHLKEKHKKS